RLVQAIRQQGAVRERGADVAQRGTGIALLPVCEAARQDRDAEAMGGATPARDLEDSVGYSGRDRAPIGAATGLVEQQIRDSQPAKHAGALSAAPVGPDVVAGDGEGRALGGDAPKPRQELSLLDRPGDGIV